MPQFNPEWLGMGYGLVMGVFETRCCPRGQRQGGVGVRLKDPGGLDRQALPPGQQLLSGSSDIA